MYYTLYDNYYYWKNLEIPEKGRKFFTCDIANGFKFEYWIFVNGCFIIEETPPLPTFDSNSGRFR